MPRRATPLNPEDGPQARFALALRQLRDEAGFDALPVDVIAVRTGIPRATLYHAMRGTRVPTLPVLAALVRAWGGDEAEWVRFRSEVEDELERRRLKLTEEMNERLGGAEIRRISEHEYRETLKAADELIRTLAERGDKRILEMLAGGFKLMFDHKRYSRAVAAIEEASEVQARIAAAEAAEDIHRAAEEWYVWRRRAGYPSIRTIASEAQLSFSAVSKVLRGLADPSEEPEITEAVFNVLRSHADRSGTSLDGAQAPPD
jgi:transcriptional regulator with XRE-family HTH domain